ncbi:MAG: C39 family peptidase, partial [Anaerolineales bacterium]
LPDSVYLPGARFEYQGLNNCGPANLAMTLSYWGWEGDQRPVAAHIKPNPGDKNVMPYELAAFVEDQTDFEALVRVGGDLELLNRLLAAGIPPLVEKGYDIRRTGMGWYGHYEVLLGYDEAQQRFVGHDSYVGKDQPISYELLEASWRHFNYTYIVVYPSEREAEVLALLGPAADETTAIQLAAQRASDEIFRLQGRDQFFAWFNRGTNLVLLQDYGGGAAAYDEAYALQASLNLDDLSSPWRILWYQTGAYWAYYYTGRYSEVYRLALVNLDEANPKPPQLEESLFWRGLAREALGDVDGAIADLRLSLEYHLDFEPSLAALVRMGVSP